MHHARGNEEDVTRAEAMPLVAVPEVTGPLSHHVHLVAGVGRLGIASTGGVELDAQRPVPEELDETLTLGPGKSSETVGDGELVFRHRGFGIGS